MDSGTSKLMNSKVVQTIIKAAEGFAANRMVQALSRGMLGVLSLMMVSAVATLINSFTFFGIDEFFARVGVTAICNTIVNMTSGVIALFVAFDVAYNVGEQYETDPLNCGVMGLMVFLILTPLMEDGNLSLSDIGEQGMFVSMFAALFSARFYVFMVQHNITIRMPDVVPPAVTTAFKGIIPAVALSMVAGIIAYAMSFTSYGSLSNMLYTMLQQPLLAMGSNIWTAMFIVAFIEFLWFFGMHGAMVVMPILMAVFMEPQVANMMAYNAGEALPYIFTYGFIMMNRGPRSFAVAIHCLFTCKSERLKAVGKVGIVPATFAISEPIKFGIPQVMNIRMLIPLMLTPALSVLSAYLLTIVGFLPYHNGIIPSGIPVILLGYFGYGWQGIVAQIIQFIICFVVYIPFMRWEDNVALKEEAERAAELAAEAEC